MVGGASRAHPPTVVEGPVLRGPLMDLITRATHRPSTWCPMTLMARHPDSPWIISRLAAPVYRTSLQPFHVDHLTPHCKPCPCGSSQACSASLFAPRCSRVVVHVLFAHASFRPAVVREPVLRGPLGDVCYQGALPDRHRPLIRGGGPGRALHCRRRNVRIARTLWHGGLVQRPSVRC